jgi:hypothetical protein
MMQNKKAHMQQRHASELTFQSIMQMLASEYK